MTIKNIIFDLGGVILDIDFSRTSEAFRDLGSDRFDEVFSKQHQDSLFDDYETGKIAPSLFRDGLRSKLGIRPTDNEFDAAWNAMLIDLPRERLDFIRSLGGERRIFLFSNTNDIHLRKILDICNGRHGISTFSDYFEREYYSHIMGMRKPDPASFSRIAAENTLAPSETLFVDDSLPNVQGAGKAGLHGLHLSADMTLFDILKFLG